MEFVDFLKANQNLPRDDLYVSEIGKHFSVHLVCMEQSVFE